MGDSLELGEAKQTYNSALKLTSEMESSTSRGKRSNRSVVALLFGPGKAQVVGSAGCLLASIGDVRTPLCKIHPYKKKAALVVGGTRDAPRSTSTNGMLLAPKRTLFPAVVR